MSDVHQCPRCALRFMLRTELDDHLRCEHPDDLDDDITEFDRPDKKAKAGAEPEEPAKTAASPGDGDGQGQTDGERAPATSASGSQENANNDAT